MNIKRFITAVGLSVAVSAAALPVLPVYAGNISAEQSYDGETPATAGTIDFSLDYTTHAYTGNALTPTVTNVTYSNSRSTPAVSRSPLSIGSDYTVSYSNNNDVGTATVTVTGQGDKFEDLARVTASKTFTITPASPVISFPQARVKTYDGTPITVTSSDYMINGLENTGVLGTPTIEYYVGGKWVTTAPTNAGSYQARVSYAAVKTADKKNTNINEFTGITTLTINKKTIGTANGSNGVTATTNAPEGGYTYKKDTKFTPTVTVTDGARTLNAQDNSMHKTDYDYTVSYEGNTKVGTAYAVVTGHGNYSGEIRVPFKINEADLTKTDATSLTVTFKDNKDSFAYTGSEIKPTITVKDGDKTLVANMDYTLSYKNNKEPGDKDDTTIANRPTITITGKGSYTNSKDVYFTIGPADLDGVTISSIPNQTYTGAAIKPDVVVKKGNQTLVEGTDYTTSVYGGDANAIAAGSYKLIITGKNGSAFTGTREAAFKIVPKSLTGATVTLNKDQWDYTGSNITPTPSVYVNLSRSRASELLTAGTDYTVSYSNNVNVGTGTVTITGKGNYSGTLSKTFTIGQVKSDSIDGAKIAAIADQTYTGSAIRPGISVTLNGKALSSSAYDVNYSNNVNAGYGTVYITGKGKYGGSAQATFKIKPAPISSVSVSGLTAQKYTGFAVQPSLILAYGGKTLRQGTDYMLVFTDNANLGNGKVAIYGLGNFTGTVNKTFPITKQGSDDEKEKVEATGFTLDKEYTVGAGGSVTLTPILTPENASKYQIRWSSSNASFVFTNSGGRATAITTESTPAVVRAADNGSSTITAELIVNGETAARVQTKVKVIKKFSDVPDSEYYSEAVYTLANYSYEKDGSEICTPVINGTSSTTFTPLGDVTRAQFVMMLYNKAVADYKAGKSSSDPSKAPASSFSDVTSYKEAINWAVANGITFGKGNNTFDPNGTVTRAEAVAFLQRYMKGGNTSTSNFTDVKNDAYYAGAVGWAVANGITAGTSNTTFSPQQKCNRAQAATFIYRTVF